MRPGTTIVICGVIGFVVGIIVSVITGLRFGPEIGAIGGGLVGLFLRRDDLQR